MIYSNKVKLKFEYIDPCLCNAWVATAVIGSGIIGAGAQIIGAQTAASAQRDSATAAINMQQGQYQQTRTDLAPYRDAGVDATGRLRSRLTELTSPISIDPNTLENSDYYKFASTQGQRAVTNSAAARGLASSGAALKGAATFAKGLATDTYKTAFDMENTNQSNAYNRLKGLIDTGGNASAMTGQLGEKAAYNSGVATIGAGNATAAADNRTGSVIGNLSSNVGGYAMYQGMYGSPTNGVAPGTVRGGVAYGGPDGPTPFAA